MKAATLGIFMVYVLICLQTNLFETIQLIQDNNAYHELLSEGTGQLMSNIVVHPPMIYPQQVVVIWIYAVYTFLISQVSKNEMNLTIYQ